MRHSSLPNRLETERLVLRAEQLDDAEWFAELLNERDVGTFTIDDAQERIATTKALMASIGIGALTITVKPDLIPIGYCAIVLGRSTLEEPELAYELLSRAHGNGYATEGSKALLDAAFATGRTRIWSTMRPSNTASINVVTKLGFQLDRTTTDKRGEVLWFLCESPRQGRVQVSPGQSRASQPASTWTT